MDYSQAIDNTVPQVRQDDVAIAGGVDEEIYEDMDDEGDEGDEDDDDEDDEDDGGDDDDNDEGGDTLMLDNEDSM